MELSRIQKKHLALIYDSKLSALPKLSDVYKSRLDTIKSRRISITEDELKEQQEFLSDVCKDYLQSFEVGSNELGSIVNYAKNIDSKLKLEVPNKSFDISKISLNDALFIETKYVGYFLSNHIDPRRETRPLLKLTFSKLGENLYKFQEEIIIISNIDYNWISKTITNECDGKAPKKVSELESRASRKLWNFYIHDDTCNTEYIINDPVFVDNINNYIDFLIRKYLVGISINDLLDRNSETWKKVGYKLYDNRGHQLFSSKTKTLRSQI